MTATTTAVILAGGEGRRMQGRDKGWIEWRGRALIEHVLAAVEPCVDTILISANRNIEAYQQLGHTVISDKVPFQGPLWAIAQALETITTTDALVVPVDAPYLSPELPALLYQQRPASLILLKDHVGLQPLFGLYRRSLLPALQLAQQQHRHRLVEWCLQQEPRLIDIGSRNCCTNLNTPSDLNNAQP